MPRYSFGGARRTERCAGQPAQSSLGETIDDLLDDEHDYLVIVGALHLVGEDGVPRLLEKQGFSIQQLSEPATIR